MKYGDWSQNGDYFIVSDPATPKPWRQYFGNRKILSSVTQHGSGEALVKDGDGENHQLLENQNGGRLFYFRDGDTGKYWSPSWWPTKPRLEFFEARHQLGATTIIGAYDSIESAITITNLPDNAAEIWTIKLKNRSAKKRKIGVFTAAQWPKGMIAETIYYKKIILQSERTIGSNRLVRFMTMLGGESDACGLAEGFMDIYDDYRDPRALRTGSLEKRFGNGKGAIGCLQKNVTLGGGESVELTVVVGAIESTGQGSLESRKTVLGSAISKIATTINSSIAAQNTEELTGRLQQHRLGTPEKTFDRYYNYFLPYQAGLSADWPGLETENAHDLYLSGIGALNSELDAVERLIFKLCAKQTKDGRLANSWGVGEETGASDNVIDSWYLAELVRRFIIETGEIVLLRCPVDYLDGGSGTVLEHLTRAINYLLDGCEDSLVVISGIQSIAESAKLLELLNGLIPILEKEHDPHLVAKYRNHITSLKQRIEKMWQSPWYSWGRQHGQRIGHNISTNGWDLAAQIWPVIAGATDERRAKELLRRIAQETASHGPLNFTRAYGQPDPGRLASLAAPGQGKNSSIQAETAIEAIRAAAQVGNGELAWRFVTQIAAPYLSGNADRYKAEPFWQAESIDGPESSHAGEGRSALSNSAGYLGLVVTEWIFGLRPTLDGLLIDPCIPKNWRQVELSRHWRGADYHIHIDNPFRVGRGVDRLIVDGIRVSGQLVHPFESGLHYIEVVLG